MSYPGAGQMPPTIYPPPKKSAPIVAIILGIAALLIVLAVGGGIHGVQAVKDNFVEAIAVGNSFIDNRGQHDWAAANSLLTPPGQAKAPADSLEDMETLVEKHHGAFVNHGQPQQYVQDWNGQTNVRLTYSAQFTKSDSAVSMILVKTEAGYQVYAAHYEFQRTPSLKEWNNIITRKRRAR